MNRTCMSRTHSGRRWRKPARHVMMLLACGAVLLAGCAAADESGPGAALPAIPQDTPATTVDALSPRDVDSTETPAAPVRQVAPLTPDPLVRGTDASAAFTSTTILECHAAYSPCIPFVEGDAFDCSGLNIPLMGIVIWELADDPYRLGDGEQFVACTTTVPPASPSIELTPAAGDVSVDSPVTATAGADANAPLTPVAESEEATDVIDAVQTGLPDIWEDIATTPECVPGTTATDERPCQRPSVGEVIRLFGCAGRLDESLDFEQYRDSAIRMVNRTRPLDLVPGTRIAWLDTCPDGGAVKLMTVTAVGGVATRFPHLTEEVYEVYICVERHSAGGVADTSGFPPVERWEALYYAWRIPDGRYHIESISAHAIGDC